MKKENKNPSSGRKEFGNYMIGSCGVIQARRSGRAPSGR